MAGARPMIPYNKQGPIGVRLQVATYSGCLLLLVEISLFGMRGYPT